MHNFESPVYAYEPNESLLQRSPVLKWVVIVGVWAFLGLVYSAPIYLEVRSECMGHPAWRIFAWGILTWVAWAPLTPFVVWLARRYSLAEGQLRRNVIFHIPAFLLFSALHSAAATTINLTIQPFENMGSSPMGFWPRFLSRFQASLGADLLVYGAIVGV